MHDDLWHHACKEESKQADGEPEICPVMSILHYLQSVTREVDSTVEVHLMECLHGNFVLAIVFGTVTLRLEMQVMFDRSSWITNFFILSWRNARGDGPESYQKRQSGEEGEEAPGEKSPTNLASKVGGD